MTSTPVFQRKSLQRDTILEVLASTCSHPDAIWIYENVKKQIPNISLGTIYRNLAELSKKGIILELNAKDNVKNYDATVSHHSHFICSSCGSITDIFNKEQPDSTVDGNHIDYMSVMYYGVCKNCLEKSN